MFKTIEQRTGVSQPEPHKPYGLNEAFPWIILLPVVGIFMAGKLAYRRERGGWTCLAVAVAAYAGWYLLFQLL